ncbi:MAG: hypothetical protein Q7U28_06840 [Aquabacterium sp.]|nr:hypothetical protein [Aquabacterium sp.]
MPTTQSPIVGLLSRLNSVGIPSTFARKMLPVWWEDEIASDPAGLQQAQLYLARAFNIDLRSLASRQGKPEFKASLRKFKLSKNVTEDMVSLSANYVTGIARLVLQAEPSRQQCPVPGDPATLRSEILVDHPCVSLQALLAWCNKSGIPVLHIDKVPGRKMTGLVVRNDGRFAIVLSKKGHPALLLFHLAHELGHIARGHLSADGFVADVKIDTTNGDADEKEADAYAIRLLNGAEVRYGTNGPMPSAKVLFKAAVAKGLQEQVDPGHIIANFGHNQSRYAQAAEALKLIDGAQQGGDVINEAFFSALNQDRLSDDQLDLLKIATSYSR